MDPMLGKTNHWHGYWEHLSRFVDVSPLLLLLLKAGFPRRLSWNRGAVGGCAVGQLDTGVLLSETGTQG